MTYLEKKPIVTIITIVFNNYNSIEETIKSVLGQTYNSIEYIIIDGGSIDGTVEIIKKYDQMISYWQSEPDEGIYDAMNKGIKLASGEWVNFMNSGDVFNSSDTLELIFNLKKYSEDILFGDMKIRYQNFDRIQRSGKINDLWCGMQFSHQSVFTRTKYHKDNLFNKYNKIAADLEFFYRSKEKGVNFRNLNIVVSSVEAGGVSDIERVKTIDAWMNVVKSNENKIYIIIYYFLLKAVVKFRIISKKYLPRSLVECIIRAKK